METNHFHVPTGYLGPAYLWRSVMNPQAQTLRAAATLQGHVISPGRLSDVGDSHSLEGPSYGVQDGPIVVSALI